MTFVAAPMVHWPEAMVTFDTTNGVLFSADAFGYVRRTGRQAVRRTRSTSTATWIERRPPLPAPTSWANTARMSRLLLKKAAGILDQIKFICPLHGPVWRKAPDVTLSTSTSHWSTLSSRRKRAVMIAYASMYGNTEAAAQCAGRQAGVKRACATSALYDVSNTHVSRADFRNLPAAAISCWPLLTYNRWYSIRSCTTT